MEDHQVHDIESYWKDSAETYSQPLLVKRQNTTSQIAVVGANVSPVQSQNHEAFSKMGANGNLQKSYFDVLGICCASEVPLIENILKSLHGVKQVSVIVPTRTVIVVHDNNLVSPLQIVKALNQAKLEANVRANGVIQYQKKWPSPFAMASALLLALSFLKYVYHPLQWLAVGAVVVGIYPMLLKGFAAIRNLSVDINILMLIAVIGSLAMKDFTEAAIIVFLFTTADWLESRATHKATAAMSSLMSIAPQRAVIAKTGEEVNVSEVKLNTVLAVKEGEVIPIDGVVVDGKCEVDEKTLTGESLPVTKEKDSTVWAGTINLNGYICLNTTAIAEDCLVAKMAKLVEEAQNSKSRTQRFIDRCARFYTPAIIIVSAAIAVIPAAFRMHNLKHWFHLALVVLVSACPCALILSTPVATFCALTKAATSGVLIKGSDYLEILSKIRITAFDKTGTLSRGEFVVNEFQSLCEDISLNTLLYWVSSIESMSSHPMAAALVEFGRSQSVEPKPETVEDYQNFPGEGVYGRIDGRDIYIGNRKISARAHGTGENFCLLSSFRRQYMRGGKTMGCVFSGASLVGIFSLSDACRTGAAEAVNELKSMGITTAMLTGDNQAVAMHVQEQLGNALDVIHAELLPEDKARIIKEFKKEGPTAMIGDGINDAPALATADIGISMGISGSALATETGHVVLMSNDIRKIPEAIRLARKAHQKVIENVIASISAKAAILAVAFAGHPLVLAAVLADVGTCLLVICNSMLLLRGSVSNGSPGRDSINKNVQKACETKKCSSQRCASKCQSNTLKSDSCSNSSGGSKCVDSTSTQDGSNGAKHCVQGCCKDHKIGGKSLLDHSCSNSSQGGNCVKDGSNEAKHCVQGCCKGKNLLDNSWSNSSQGGSNEAKHCVQGCCNDPKIEAKNLSGPTSQDHKSVNASSIRENRGSGGCCRSCRKRCCGGRRQIASGSGGDLIEIITA